MTTRHILVSALLAAMASSTVHAAEAGANANANAGQMAFEQLKQLTGAWRPAENPASALRVEFSLIAGDSVVTETWSAPGHASMTVYHLDGERLLATHYCPRGNQPRMAFTQRNEDGTLRFEFVDGTGLDEPGEPYEHLLTMRTAQDGTLVRGETYVRLGEAPGPLDAPELRHFVRLESDDDQG